MSEETSEPISLDNLSNFLLRDIIFLKSKTYLVYCQKSWPPFLTILLIYDNRLKEIIKRINLEKKMLINENNIKIM
jgi:hypothetical protein